LSVAGTAAHFHCSKDGFLFELLGVELGRHIGNTLKALDLHPNVYLSLAYTIITNYSQ